MAYGILHYTFILSQWVIRKDVRTYLKNNFNRKQLKIENLKNNNVFYLVNINLLAAFKMQMFSLCWL